MNLPLLPLLLLLAATGADEPAPGAERAATPEAMSFPPRGGEAPAAPPAGAAPTAGDAAAPPSPPVKPPVDAGQAATTTRADQAAAEPEARPIRLLRMAVRAPASLTGLAALLEEGLDEAMRTPDAVARFVAVAATQPGGLAPADTCNGEGTPALRCWGNEGRFAAADFVLLPGIRRHHNECLLELRLLHPATASVAREALHPLPSCTGSAPDASTSGAAEAPPAARPQPRRIAAAGLAQLLWLNGKQAEPLSGMVAIPAGSFPMGSEAPAGEADELPLRRVSLAAFWIDRTEVSVAAYRTCVERGECDVQGPQRAGEEAGRCTWQRPDTADHPLSCIGWEQARNYCRSLGKTLPSEARWERAARGEAGQRFPWGNEWPPPPGGPNLADRAAQENLRGWPVVPAYDDGHALTAPVGKLPRDESPAGARDMGGNVAEWTLDCYDPRGYGDLPTSEPMRKGGDGCALRVVRGGSWFQDHLAYLRAANRQSASPQSTSPQLGFRCVSVDRSGSPPPRADVERGP